MARRPFPTQAELLPYADKFWSGVAKSGDDDCWLWMRGRDSNGYGGLSINGRVLRCHKLAYLFSKGDIPAGIHIRHSCDNPPCCNPSHLLPGTHQDNMRDKAERGRVNNPQGSDSPRAKLTSVQVLELLRMHDEGTPKKDLSKRFGISCPVVRKIIRGDAYKNVPRPHFPITEGAAQ